MGYGSGLGAKGLWLAACSSKLFDPLHNPPSNIIRILKPHLVEDEAGHAAAAAGAAMNDDLFVFHAFELVELHGLKLSKRDQFAAEI